MEDQLTVQAPAGLNVLQPDETAEQRIKQEVRKFDFIETKLQEMADAAQAVTIRPLPPADNAEGMKAWREEVAEARKVLSVVRTARTNLEKKRTELKSDYLEIGRGIDKRAREIGDRIKPIEEPLSEKVTAAEKALEDRKFEAERAAEQRLHKRVAELLDAGAKFDGNFYTAGEISVDVVTIKTLTDDRFEELKTKVKEASVAAAEAARKAEEDRLAELDRQRKEREKLDEDRRKLDEEKRDLERQKEEARNNMISSRRAVLEGLGMRMGANLHFYFKLGETEVEVSAEEITDSTGEEWPGVVDEVRKMIADAQATEADRLEKKSQKEAEDKRLEAIFQERRGQILSLGFGDNAGGVFVFNAPLMPTPVSISAATVRECSAEHWPAVLHEARIQKEGLQELSFKAQAEETERKDQQRRAAMAEADRMIEWLKSMLNVPAPNVSDESNANFVFKLRATMETAIASLN